MIRFLSLCILLIGFMQVSKAQELTFRKTEEGAWIYENGEKVLFYQARTKDLDGQRPRANYIHPLYNVNGEVITEDFPKDHLHHRGIFCTWHQVLVEGKKIGDAWECKDFIWDVQRYDAQQGEDKSISLASHILWKSPQWKNQDGEMEAFVKEKMEITVYPKSDNYRILDFEISLLAMESDVKIGGSDDHKGYGGFSVRMKMPDDLTFASENGFVTPQVGQVEAGSWMDISGSLNKPNEKEGVAIICHPDNPMYPEKWILRKQGSMQNPVFPGREPLSLSMTEPLVLKYRLIVYAGHLHAQEFDQNIKDFQ